MHYIVYTLEYNCFTSFKLIINYILLILEKNLVKFN